MSDFTPWMKEHPFYGFVLLMTALLGATAVIRAVAKIFHKPVPAGLNDQERSMLASQIAAILSDRLDALVRAATPESQDGDVDRRREPRYYDDPWEDAVSTPQAADSAESVQTAQVPSRWDRLRRDDA